MNKVYISFLVLAFLFVSDFLSAQENDIYYSPAQLKEDADFFFNTLYERHPNPYYYCGMEDFEQKKHQIYEQLKTPMTKDEFIAVMSAMSSCLDSHIGASFSTIELYAKKGLEILEKSRESIFPLRVYYNDGVLSVSIDSCEFKLLSVNGVESDEMIEKITALSANNTSSFKKFIVENTFYSLLSPLFDMYPPYVIEYVNDGRIVKRNLEEIPVPTWSYSQVYERPHQIYYEIYPQSSIAILYILSFSEEIMKEENFTAVMESLSDSLKLMNIQNLFIDLSKNGGGNYDYSYQVFDYLQHDTISMSYSKISKESSVNVYIPYHKEVIRLPQRDERFFDKNLFVLQGVRTYSCGDQFCRIIAQNQLGKLIGTSTSTYTKDFGNVLQIELPNTKIPVGCPTALWDFSVDFKTETLDPDIYFWDVDYTNEFSEEELLNLIRRIQEVTE